MRIGEVFRYQQKHVQKKTRNIEIIDGLPNFPFFTNYPGAALVQLESGINPIGKSSGDKITPAILISSSPHKVGSSETPWQDFFAPERGHIRYSGDNKSSNIEPHKKEGNKSLLNQFRLHNSDSEIDRLNASPIIFFKKVSINGRAKGNYEFNGFGIINAAERVVQYNRATKSTFVNYIFDFTVLDISEENENFDWNWINSRRNTSIDSRQSLKLAPKSWQEWVKNGKKSYAKIRRQVSKLNITTTQEQKPEINSHEYKVLEGIYNFYSKSVSMKKRFELLASIVAGHTIRKTNKQYIPGWITKGSGDHGIDFIGRLDIGEDFGKAKLIVLGQAKCEKLDEPTGGNHIARTAAKLKRGWLGVYVTTSYFSENVQLEILDDKYPILLINGLDLAKSVIEIMHLQSYEGLEQFLEEIDLEYEEKVRDRDPEEILID